MLDRTNLVALMKQVAKADPSAPVAYSWNNQQLSYAALNQTLRNELNELAGTYAQYRENKNLIFSMIEETLDEVLPKKVTQQYEQFAEVKTFISRLIVGTETFRMVAIPCIFRLGVSLIMRRICC